MIKNYLKIAVRNLRRHKGFSFINIMGLAIGMSCCLLILEFVFFELSYDRFNKNGDQVYKVYAKHFLNGKVTSKAAHTAHGLGPVMKKDYPEVEDFARLTWGGNLIKYSKGADLRPREIEFKLKGYPEADTVAVVGIFNRWNHKANSMLKDGDIWKTTIRIYPDTYEYKIYVDGEYLLDSLNPDTIRSYGNINSRLNVKPLKAGGKEVILNVDNTYYADASLFSFFSFPLISGSSDALNQPDVSLISETTAKNIFGDEDPIGKTLTIEGGGNGTENYIVKGVFKDIPQNSHLKFNMLFSFKNVLKRDMYKDPWVWDNFYTYIKIKQGVDPIKLEEGFKSLNKTYFPWTLDNGHLHEFSLIGLKNIHLHADANGEFEGLGKYNQVLFLSIIVFLILVIAYVNYINLATVRSIDRAKEVGVRKVTGATKVSLIKQFMFESFLLSFLGLGIALVIVLLTQPLFNQLVNKHLYIWKISDIKFWLIILFVFVIGATLSGIYPALLISSFKTITALKGRIKTNSGLLLRKSLVVLQFAASITLIAGTFAVYKQINFMKEQDLGFKKEQVLIVNGPQKSGIGFDSNLSRFRSELLNTPSIDAFCASTSLPSKGISWGTSDVRRSIDPISVSNSFEFYWVDEDYIPLYEMEMVAGQKFSKKFTPEENGIILTETACKRLGYKNPEESLNQIIVMENYKAKVLGVVKDYNHSSLKDNYRPFILFYSPFPKQYFSIKIKSPNIKPVIRTVEEKFNSIFPGNTLNYYFLDEEFNKQYQEETIFGKVFGLFTALALLVACLGLLGLATFTILQRTKEIGVRKVLGATIYNLCILLTNDFLKLVLIGNLIGLPLAYYFINKWLENYAFKIPLSWWILVIPSVIILLISLITISFQTVKTALENPVKSLRTE